MADKLKEIVEKLGTARDMIAMLNSPIGETFTEKELSKKVSDTYYSLMGDIDGAMSEAMQGGFTEAKNIHDQLNEWKDLKKDRLVVGEITKRNSL